jgi:hypothetical protein
MNPLFATALHETNPLAILPKVSYRCDDNTQVGTLPGRWLRVFPQTPRDVAIIRQFEFHKERFAPAEGHGVLVPFTFLDL